MLKYRMSQTYKWVFKCQEIIKSICQQSFTTSSDIYICNRIHCTMQEPKTETIEKSETSSHISDQSTVQTRIIIIPYTRKLLIHTTHKNPATIAMAIARTTKGQSEALLYTAVLAFPEESGWQTWEARQWPLGDDNKQTLRFNSGRGTKPGASSYVCSWVI